MNLITESTISLVKSSWKSKIETEGGRADIKNDESICKKFFCRCYQKDNRFS